MTTVIDPTGTPPSDPIDKEPSTSVGRVRKGLTNPLASGIALAIGILWTIPTLSLLIQSFRGKAGQQSGSPWSFSDLTLSNYKEVLSGNSSLLPYIVNSIVIVIPAAVIPIVVAALASYALVWIDFRGRDWIYVAIFALQVVPLQVAVVPLCGWWWAAPTSAA